VDQDPDRIVAELELIGAAGEEHDRAGLERDIRHLLAQYYGRSLREFRVTALMQDVLGVVRRHHLRLPPEVGLLLKTVAMSEALVRHLDPSFDAVAVAEPYLRRAIRQLYSPGYWVRTLRSRPLEVMLLGAALPGYLQRLLIRLDRDELTIRVRSDELPRALASLNDMANRLAAAVLVAAAGIGLLALYETEHPRLWSVGGVVFLVACLAVLGAVLRLLLDIWRSGRSRWE
jgi:ubiquinone biosynthesis protein